MAKARTQFLCNNCGSVHPKWMGKCPDCGTWDSLEEYKEPAFDERAERSGKLAAEVERGVASANSIASSEAASSPDRPSSSAASQELANRPCCFRWPIRSLQTSLENLT